MKIDFKVDCDVCDEKDHEITTDQITVVHNLTHHTYLIAFNCPNTNIRTSYKLLSEHEQHVYTMRDAGANYMVTSDPHFSRRPWGPPLDKDDLISFRESLKNHDHLAAYA